MDIIMSIVDYIPVVAFLISSIILQRCLYNKMSKGAFALFSAGTIFVFLAGLYKATHKMLYYTGVCDWPALKNCFFIMQTTGFVLAGSSMIALLFFKQGENKVYSFGIPAIFLTLLSEATPKEFSGTMVFVVLMVLGVMVFDAGLITIAIKMKKPIIIVLLAISFVFVLGMGYLSTKDAMSDWIKEFVNSIGQGTLLAATILLKKNGLEDKDFQVSFIK